MGVATILLTAQTAALVVASLLLLYPVVYYAWNVAYTDEILLLATSFVLLAASYVMSFVVGAPLASSALDLLSALCAFAAMWQIGTRFVRDEADLAITEPSQVESGGFGGSD